MMTATSAGVLDGMQWVPHYAAINGVMPAGVFLTSFPMGLPHPHQWDMLFDSYGGTEIARELYARHGLHFVGHVHHDMNLIHSNVPIRSLEDFQGLSYSRPIARGYQSMQSAPERSRWRDQKSGRRLLPA